jgi:hypothetical protein
MPYLRAARSIPTSSVPSRISQNGILGHAWTLPPVTRLRLGWPLDLEQFENSMRIPQSGDPGEKQGKSYLLTLQ